MNISDQGSVDARLRFVEPVNHVSDNLLETLPEIGRASRQRLTDVGIDLLCHPCLLLDRMGSTS